MRAADIKAAAYLSDEVDRAVAAASLAVDKVCNRGDATRAAFAPWTGTRTFSWPNAGQFNSFKFYLNELTLLSQSAITSAGDDVTSDVFLEPTSSGPPYSRIEINRDSSSFLDSGDASGQRSLVVTGVWGYCDTERANSAWTLTTGVTGTPTSVTIKAPLGVGDTIRIDSERMIVTDRTWVTSSQTGSLASSQGSQSLAVSDGTAFLAGEELLLDAERMLVRDVVGNTLIVQRAVGGSTLAAHTSATIYYSRTFTVERGAVGTTTASHSTSAAVYIHQPPALIEQLTIAYALDQRAQESSVYARTVGMGDSERNATGLGLKDLETRVVDAFGRKIRHRAV